ncbi:MAG: efflux RND transporter periplasmic adaptor subunit [Methylophilus sp.]|nr:efflux RND transporter periplasmic adaptor subunit [Methylophilus sp.]
MQNIYTRLILASFVVFSVGCGNGDSDSQQQKAIDNGTKPTLVTVTTIKKQIVELTEDAVGTLEGLIDPTVASEVAARVVKVHVSPGDPVTKGQLLATLDATDFTMQRNEALAEVNRIQALLENQAKIVARNQTLVDKKFISQNVVDNDKAQQNVLKQQLEAATARVGTINHNSSKTRIVSPVNGTVETRLVSAGDYLKMGDPILQIISKQKLRAHLPFPEHIGAKLKPGLKVRLTTPTSTKAVETVIQELKPLIAEGSRTIDVIADVVDEPGWQPGATVNGTVILGEESSAMMIPEQSLVLRPAGEVVYVVRDGMAYQAVVKTGYRKNGLIELLEGLQPDATIVVDGAGFLTDKTPVTISN